MAVIGKVEVSIECGGAELREYDPPAEELLDVPDDEQSSSDAEVNYIEAVPDTNFSVKCQVMAGFAFGEANSVYFNVHVDEKEKIAGDFCGKWEMKRRRRGWKLNIDGGQVWKPQEEKWVTRPFRWEKLFTSDEHYISEDEEKYPALGTIVVEVWRCTGRRVPVPADDDPEESDTHRSVSEKVIKGAGLDLQIKLEETEIPYFGDQQAPESWISDRIDPKPLAIFTFKYRSKQALQSLGILERPESPVPLEERDIDTLTQDELRELTRQLKATQEAQKVLIKQEKTQANLAQLAGLTRSREQEDDVDDELEILESRPVKKTCRVVELSDDSD